MEKNFKVDTHKLVPKHVKLNDTEIKKLLEEYKITTKDLPKILADDPAIAELNAKQGDVIKITRESKTAGEIMYYREVIDG
jgi:DNA-directed RNA polymerase subunit H (RpoH/RPB5)